LKYRLAALARIVSFLMTAPAVIAAPVGDEELYIKTVATMNSLPEPAYLTFITDLDMTRIPERPSRTSQVIGIRFYRIAEANEARCPSGTPGAICILKHSPIPCGTRSPTRPSILHQSVFAIYVFGLDYNCMKNVISATSRVLDDNEHGSHLRLPIGKRNGILDTPFYVL
jgi:hypothetical protein